MASLNTQLNWIGKFPDDSNSSIFPDFNWTLEDYKEFMHYIAKGILVQQDFGVRFMANEEHYDIEEYLKEWEELDEEICPSCGDEWTDATRCDCPNS